MISRNVKRLLTSILDGRLKRGAFYTSTLDGTPKRGAFCTSTLDGRLKRDAFLCTRVGAYCIRPTKRSRKGTGSAKGDQTCDFLSPTGPFGRAYLSTPYHATSKRDAFYTSYLVATLKRGAFCTSYLVATPKRGAFCTSTLDGRLKRDAFLCTRVGAYCIRPTFSTIRVECMQIRPTKRSRKRTGSAKGDQTCDSLSPTGPFGGAYSIRPYHATSKRGAFCTSYLVAIPKRGAFWTSYLLATLKRAAFYTSYLVATLKRGAFCTSYLVATPKRGAFCTSYLVGSLKRDAFCLFYSSFLALMQEKKQKKIKASGMPAKFSGYIIGEVGICATYQANFPASAEAASQVCWVHDRRGKDR